MIRRIHGGSTDETPQNACIVCAVNSKPKGGGFVGKGKELISLKHSFAEKPSIEVV
jgi:hypothetical protein